MNASTSSVESKDETPLEKTVSTNTNLDRHETHQDIELHPTTPSQHHHDLALSRTKSIAETLSPLREFLFISLLCSAQFVTQAGLLNTLNILHIIGADLGITSPGILSWLIAGYSLTVGTFILLSGRCGDLFGYKNMLVVGFAWFAVWNVVAGCSVYVAGNGGQVLFIFARVLGGMGPAVLLPNALGLLGATYRNGRRKDMVFSLFGACAPGELGPTSTERGLCADCDRWCDCRWNVFWVVVVGMVAVDVLVVWDCPGCPRDVVDIHTSFGTAESRSARSFPQKENVRT
jgi:hypothetical protein